MSSLNVMAYNTHLFGTFAGIPGTGWKDDTRFEQLKTCIKTPSVCNADLISLEEIWSSDFVDRITQDSVSDLYPNHYKNFDAPGHGHPSNPAGLLLLGNQRFTFNKDKAVYVDFIHEFLLSGFDKQDLVTAKGCFVVPATLDGTPIVIALTHMPTNSGTYTTSLQKCFQCLADTINSARTSASTPTLLLGDLNIKEAADTINFGGNPKFDRYTEWVSANGILGKIGLVDVYRSLYPSDPGFSVVGSTNTCWRHFANGKAPTSARIDYVLCSGMQPSSARVAGMPPADPPNYTDTGNQWVWTDHGNTRDISDHYPFMATLNL